MEKILEKTKRRFMSPLHKADAFEMTKSSFMPHNVIKIFNLSIIEYFTQS